MKVKLKQYIIDMINNSYDDWTKIDSWYYTKSMVKYFEYFEVADYELYDDRYIIIYPLSLQNQTLPKNHFEPYNKFNLDNEIFEWKE